MHVGHATVTLGAAAITPTSIIVSSYFSSSNKTTPGSGRANIKSAHTNPVSIKHTYIATIVATEKDALAKRVLSDDDVPTASAWLDHAVDAGQRCRIGRVAANARMVPTHRPTYRSCAINHSESQVERGGGLVVKLLLGGCCCWRWVAWETAALCR